MLNGVAGHVDGADVVTKDHCGMAEGGMELKEKLSKPGGLGHDIGDNAVLGFSTGAGDGHLTLG
jgi:hypothetical protein